jgi:hypothetical protein
MDGGLMPHVRTEYHWLADCQMWMFVVIDDADEVYACGSEADLEIAAKRAGKTLERLKKQ